MKRLVCLCALLAFACGCTLQRDTIVTDFCDAYPEVCQYIDLDG